MRTGRIAATTLTLFALVLLAACGGAPAGDPGSAPPVYETPQDTAASPPATPTPGAETASPRGGTKTTPPEISNGGDGVTGGGSATAGGVSATSPAKPKAPPSPQPVSKAVPRRNPSSAEVASAIRQIQARIPLYRPTEAQARDFADDICDAFDDGTGYAQIRSTVMEKVSRLPFTRVSTSDADLAIRLAVELVCPGHEPKLP
jgi:hypothetical protein